MPKPLPNFENIGPRTSWYTPSKPATGELVIICTWLGAAPKHINKYVAMYHRIAPGARILLIESAVPILVSSYARQYRHIQAAAQKVIDTLAECGSSSIVTEKPSQSPKILLHTFSNGGTNTATQLLIVLRKKSSGPIPLLGIVFDSCPAKGTYWKSHSAMVLSLPPDFATQFVGAIVVHVLLCMLYTWIACGNENPASLQRRTVLDPETVIPPSSTVAFDQQSNGHARYIYSTSDRMCHWGDVHDHAEEARQLGWNVEEVVYEGTGHCAHYSADVMRYEATVGRLWSGQPALAASTGNARRGGGKGHPSKL
ncbi:indole-diterpene biosynthesis protein-like protein PaxU [Phaeosphaeriaceae sp. PMI808]|nr:indole-diterpene biosynthesis protein-like protein PaxU [Phaeosphaeriaceae sp. PMI808]